MRAKVICHLMVEVQTEELGDDCTLKGARLVAKETAEKQMLEMQAILEVSMQRTPRVKSVTPGEVTAVSIF
jgi:hypothetical protein